MRKDLIDLEALDELITQHKHLYLQSHINTIKIPSMNNRCQEEIDTTESEEKKEALRTQIETNNANLNHNKEQMKSLEEMIDSFISFKNELCQ